MTIACCIVEVARQCRLFYGLLRAMFGTAPQFCVASTLRILAEHRLRGFLRVCFLLGSMLSAIQTRGALRRIARFVCWLPSASFRRLRLAYFHLRGQLGASFPGLGQTPRPLACARSACFFARERPANTRSYAPMGTVVLEFLLRAARAPRVVVQLSNLHGLSRACLPNIYRTCRGFLPRFLPFGAPLNGL